MTKQSAAVEELDFLAGARPVAADETFYQPIYRELYETWRDAAAGGTLPHPDIFDMVEHSVAAQSWAWLDVLNDGEDFQVRFTGTYVDQLVGKPTTGMKLSELGEILGPRAADRLAELLNMAKSLGEPVLAGPRRTSLPEREFITTSTITLPVSTTGGECDRILMAIVIEW